MTSRLYSPFLPLQPSGSFGSTASSTSWDTERPSSRCRLKKPTSHVRRLSMRSHTRGMIPCIERARGFTFRAKGKTLRMLHAAMIFLSASKRTYTARCGYLRQTQTSI